MLAKLFIGIAQNHDFSVPDAVFHQARASGLQLLLQHATIPLKYPECAPDSKYLWMAHTAVYLPDGYECNCALHAGHTK